MNEGKIDDSQISLALRKAAGKQTEESGILETLETEAEEPKGLMARRK